MMYRAVLIVCLISSLLGPIFPPAHKQAQTIAKTIASMSPEELSQSVVRLHILAHSDSPDDQRIKLALRDKILEVYSPLFASFSSDDEALEYLHKHKNVLESALTELLHGVEGAEDYGLKITLGEYDFPPRTYGDLEFPAGRYTALRVIIGEGQGQNWWCVLYPPLCFLRLRTDAAPGQDTAAPPDAYEDEEAIEVRWRLLEWLGSL